MICVSGRYLLGDTAVGFEDFFNIDDLNKLVPCMYFADYAKQMNPEATTHIIEGNVMNDVFVFPDKEAFKESHKLRQKELNFHRASPPRTIRDLTPGTMLYDTDVLTINNKKNRLLATWHTFFFFANEANEMGLKRLIRDHVHYTQQILDYAVRGIDELGGWGTYSAIHVRRGDFQYHEVKIGADKLFGNVEPLLKRSGK